MWYTVALILAAALFLSGVWGKTKHAAGPVVSCFLGVALATWAAFRIATGKHPVSYPDYTLASFAEPSFIAVSQWGFTQYAAIALAVFAVIAAIRSYLACRG